MSDIDFQNGFLCGLATRGHISSGDAYSPRVWNTAGVYSYFFIDFHQSVNDFSTGMFKESCTVSSVSDITITEIERVSAGVFKLYGDISQAYFGVTVTNEIQSLLTYSSDGNNVKPFSVKFEVTGITQNIRTKYLYDTTDFLDAVDYLGDLVDTFSEITMFSAITGSSAYDSESFEDYIGDLIVSEVSVTVILT
ncbi:MAG: hypothetical protein NC238_03040 [Dehalobacter sp.]|nr:hypothetical protein [Dehalobacter sp.]